MRVDQGDGEEEGLLLGRLRAQVRQDPLFARVGVAVVGHVPAVVIDDAAGGLANELVGAGVLRVPPREPIFVDVLRDPSLVRRTGWLLRRRGVDGGRLAAMPLALVGRGVTGGSHHRPDVDQIGRHLHLWVLGRRHLGLEAVLHPVLRREHAAHQGGAAGGAHAGVAGGLLETHAVLLEAAQAGHVRFLPTVGKMLGGPLLVGHEQQDVHAVEWPWLRRGAGVCAGREQRRRRGGRGRRDQRPPVDTRAWHPRPPAKRRQAATRLDPPFGSETMRAPGHYGASRRDVGRDAASPHPGVPDPGPRSAGNRWPRHWCGSHGAHGPATLATRQTANHAILPLGVARSSGTFGP